MAETTEKKKTDSPEDKTAARIEAYLQGPRKKRKNYVIFALGPRFDRDIATALEAYVRKAHPQLAITSPKNPDELTRQFGRNISLLIINDEFVDKELVIHLVRALKEKRRSEVIPVLFLTRDAEPLVETYHRELLLYNEADDYIVYPGTPRHQLLERIKSGIENQNQRRSRRYTVNVPMSFYHLNTDVTLAGRIIDLSMHGAVIVAEQDIIFRLGDQIKLTIPISDYIQNTQGDFIKISAKVRRVFISGTKVAISFEHVTDQQIHLVGKVLLAIVSTQMNRQITKLKAQHANSSSGETR